MADASAEAAAKDAGLGWLQPRSGRVRELFFYERRYDFELKAEQLIDLQDVTNAGPQALLSRLTDGAWRLDDVKEPLRLGLIGAGMDREAAFNLVERAVRPGYLAQSAVCAARVMQAVVFGVEEDAPGELKAGQDQGSQTSPTGASDGPASLEPAPPSAGRRKRSGKPASGKSAQP